MQGYIGYIRVSTPKQGTQGVSLQEQQDAILRYAARHNFVVERWLEEMETAAEGGRPIFNQALKLLRARKAKGIILHKLDRGARNLRDWTAIGELSDAGVEVHFVNEGIDLQTRGGRLSADIQAVVAADYIRNLREETRKGFYGRLKQGLYPLRAPIGYIDNGKGKPKTIDPVNGPIVRKAFELYSTGQYNFEHLEETLFTMGLRNRNGGRVTRNGISTMLNNPFYIGLMHIDKTNETFAGIHQPLITKSLFDRVHCVLTGKFNSKIQHHEFPLRRMLKCVGCNYSLVGERQKGHVYYRCHSRKCMPTSIKETAAQEQIRGFFETFRFTNQEKTYFKSKALDLRQTWLSHREEVQQSAKLRLAQLNDRLQRLTDAYVDGNLDKETFNERKERLLFERKSLEENEARVAQNPNSADPIEKFLELAGNASLSYKLANAEEKREMLKIFTSNRWVKDKNLVLEPSLPFVEIAKRQKSGHCDPKRITPRTLDAILADLKAIAEKGALPDLSQLTCFQTHHQQQKPKKPGTFKSLP